MTTLREETAAELPSQTFARRLKEVRERTGLSQEDLAERMTALGRRMDRGLIARLETGRRRVLLDEVATFALALDTSPLFLGVPIDNRPASVAPARQVDADQVRAWYRGEQWLPGQDSRVFWTQRPDGEWFSRLSGRWEDATAPAPAPADEQGGAGAAGGTPEPRAEEGDG